MRNQGFTLVEVLIAGVVVTCGLLAVASMFSFAVRVNVSNRQMAVATSLLYDKMEQFKSTPADNPLWKNPDGFDYVTQETRYMRVWQVSSLIPQRVTIIVYAENALTRRYTELIRATAQAGKTF